MWHTRSPYRWVRRAEWRGSGAQFSVTLDTKGLNVSGVQNDIIFDQRAAVAARANGKPDCVVNPAIDKNASGFAFQPPSCASSGDCDRMRAVIIAIDNSEPIPNGAVLYTCSVDIAAAALGVYPLENVEVVASAPEGVRVMSTGTDGQIVVAGASRQGLQLQSGAAAAGGGCQTTESGEPARLLAVGGSGVIDRLAAADIDAYWSTPLMPRLVRVLEGVACLLWAAAVFATTPC